MSYKKENVKKAQKVIKEKLDKDKVVHREIASKMLQEAGKDLIPNMKKKVEEVAKKIEELVGKDEGLIATQIELIIANRSINDIASVSSPRMYTAEELMIGLEMYRQVIATINTKFTYPPNKFTFCSFMGMSSSQYNNYKVDIDKAEVMQMIEDYIAGVQFTSAQLGKLKEITTIFGLKSMHGFYEAQAPVQIKGEVKVDIDEIQSQIKALNKGRVVDADFDDKD